MDNSEQTTDIKKWRIIGNNKQITDIKDWANNKEECYLRRECMGSDYEECTRFNKDQHSNKIIGIFGSCYHYTIFNKAMPENIHNDIQQLIGISVNKKESDIFGTDPLYEYEIRIIDYTFKKYEYIYEHDDNNLITILIYLDRDNIENEEKFFFNRKGASKSVELDDKLWKKSGALILGKGDTMKNMPLHGGLFFKKDKNKPAYRRILSIFVSKKIK